jgi:2-C-methyl-D-erythritol 4-phosphate cytidylyltransferase
MEAITTVTRKIGAPAVKMVVEVPLIQKISIVVHVRTAASALTVKLCCPGDKRYPSSLLGLTYVKADSNYI